jgi:hypothetical protein
MLRPLSRRFVGAKTSIYLDRHFPQAQFSNMNFGKNFPVWTSEFDHGGGLPANGMALRL